MLDKKYKHDLAVVVDRLVMRTDLRKRLADSIETAVALADGMVEIELVDEGRAMLFSEKFACPDHGPGIAELEPRIFSFNSPHGACPRCTGLGIPDGDRPGADRAGPGAVDLRGGDPPLVVELVELLRRGHPGDRRALRDRPRGAVGVADRRAARPVPLRHRRRAGLHLLPQPLRAQAVLHDQLRGDRPEPRAPLPGDGFRLVAREDRGVHVGAAVPGLRRRPAAAGVARGHRRRDGHPRVHGAVRPSGAALARGRASSRTPIARSPG